jgi:hypothetical protein
MSILPPNPNFFYKRRWRRFDVYGDCYYILVETNCLTNEEQTKDMITEKEYFARKLKGHIKDEE